MGAEGGQLSSRLEITLKIRAFRTCERGTRSRVPRARDVESVDRKSNRGMKVAQHRQN
jgi:hypothetical protein